MTIQELKRHSHGRTSIIAGCLGIFLLTPSLLLANDRLEKFELELYSGYRKDTLDWNIAYDSSGTLTPNIYSELTWDDLEIVQLGTESSLRLSNNRLPFLGLMTGYINYGAIIAGSNQDSDYAGNNRTLEFSRSNNTANDGDVWDISFAIGPEFTLLKKKLSLAPLLGYSYHEQNLYIRDGFQTIPATGSFPDLDSSYNSVWRGYWLGINLELTPNKSFSLSTRIEWHSGEYLADADWNLRDNLKHPVSFSHYADNASGLVVRLATDLSITKRLLFTTEISYIKWLAEDGVDSLFASDNSISTTRLNEVNWESSGVAIGLTTLFN